MGTPRAYHYRALEDRSGSYWEPEISSLWEPPKSIPTRLWRTPKLASVGNPKAGPCGAVGDPSAGIYGEPLSLILLGNLKALRGSDEPLSLAPMGNPTARPYGDHQGLSQWGQGTPRLVPVGTPIPGPYRDPQNPS